MKLIKCNKCKMDIDVKIPHEPRENIVCKNCKSVIKYPKSFRLIYNIIFYILFISYTIFLDFVDVYSKIHTILDLIVFLIFVSLTWIGIYKIILGAVYIIMVKLYKLQKKTQ